MSDENPWNVWYEKGKAAHAKSPNLNCQNDFKAAGGTYSPNGNTFEWSRFYDGWREAEQARIKSLYPVDEFLKELEELCLKYKSTLNSGCGCCGAGGTFSNGNSADFYEFSFSFPKLGEDSTHNT